MEVGIIGVGLMGHGIARNVLLRGKHGLSFLDHPGNQPVDELLSLGAKKLTSSADVAAASEVLILCVTGSPQVEQILTGTDGVVSHLRPGTVVVDCSTALPESTERMARAVEEAGGRFIDAPMTRLPQHAHEGKLNLLVGGDPAILERVRPVLSCFAENIQHVGAVGNGHRMKLLHNYVSVGSMSLLAEAAAQAADAGIDPKVFVEVLATGGGGGTALQRMAPFITEGDRNSVPFFVSNARKDIDYYRQMSEAAGARVSIANGVVKALSEVIDDGHGQAYVSELTKLFRRS
ncbi:MAG: 2-hydroxy-3-oxopropionate reductase [Rhodospirillaceae bacterium]|nr:2-hydroxy-3-oxopropionate reductase [Rhodospirillaceae bacterium]|tara:strand:+ start:100 stop:972 length:873 start_codon:yes stop_codon:yes gene_type:complete